MAAIPETVGVTTDEGGVCLSPQQPPCGSVYGVSKHGLHSPPSPYTTRKGRKVIPQVATFCIRAE